MTVEPNERERGLARSIAYGMPVSQVAVVLAEVRDGASLLGPRRIVSGSARVTLRLVSPENLEAATEHAWRSWFRELRRQGCRPCGWPAEQRTHVMSPQIVAGEHTWVELEDDDPRVEYLIVSVSCEAVPMT